MISLELAGKVTEQKLATLHPATRNKVLAWLGECSAEGLLIYVYEGFRSCERQSQLYAQGRTTKGRIVTKAGPGQSMHQYGLAVDFVPLKPHAKAAGQYEAAWNSESQYNQAHAIAAKHGLRRLSWETPHLEDSSFANWKAARAQFGDPCR